MMMGMVWHASGYFHLHFKGNLYYEMGSIQGENIKKVHGLIWIMNVHE
jgi:hypothetical protein